MHCAVLWEQAEKSSTKRGIVFGAMSSVASSAHYLETEPSFLLGSLLFVYLLIYLIPGVKPRAFHQQSTPTPELHPSLLGVPWDNFDFIPFKELSAVLF